MEREAEEQTAVGWAARDESGVLSPIKFSRRATGEEDVTFKVLYCGICSSDIHHIKGEWGPPAYPIVPKNVLFRQIRCRTPTNGKLIALGIPDKLHELPMFPLIMGRKLVGGSCIGGMKETQEMMEFAAKHGVKAGIEVIPVDYVNTAMQRVPEIGRQLPIRHRHRQHSES